MNGAEVLDIGREAIFVLLKVSVPIMGTALAVGVAIALFQALTQVQEMTLVFVPKIITIFLMLIVLLPYIGATLGGLMDMVVLRIIS